MSEFEQLKNLVMKKLQDQGTLGQFKAQMRAKVFEIIDNQERDRDNVSELYLTNKLIQNAKKDAKAIKSFYLLHDFLQKFELKSTMQIFKSEANYSPDKESGPYFDSLLPKREGEGVSIMERLL